MWRLVCNVAEAAVDMAAWGDAADVDVGMWAAALSS
jgi:hypothetical protein